MGFAGVMRILFGRLGFGSTPPAAPCEVICVDGYERTVHAVDGFEETLIPVDGYERTTHAVDGFCGCDC